MEYTPPAIAVQELSLKGENDWSTANRSASRPLAFSAHSSSPFQLWNS